MLTAALRCDLTPRGLAVQYARTSPVTWFLSGQPQPAMGPPHQRLLTTLAQAMGLQVDHFGLEEMLGDGGAPIDATGVLPELFG